MHALSRAWCGVGYGAVVNPDTTDQVVDEVRHYAQDSRHQVDYQLELLVLLLVLVPGGSNRSSRIRKAVLTSRSCPECYSPHYPG